MTNMFVHPLLNEIHKKGIDMTVTSDGIVIDGFYKSGTITLKIQENDKVVAISRYDERTDIKDFYDLVDLNVLWWERSRDRNEAWKKPGESWAKYYAI